MKKYYQTIVCATIFFVVASVHAHAATPAVYIETSRTSASVGDTIVVAVKINAGGSVINTVDGEVAIKTLSGSGNLSVQEVSLANSAFGLWPRTPSLSKDAQVLSFVGGVPGGFSIEGATIFKIILRATKEGVVTITPQNMSVFANDGKGTKLSADLKGLTITIYPKKADVPIQDDWSGIVSKDNIPPEDFTIVLGQDPTLFNGQKFAFFSAVDNQSGIDHYDVSEDGGPVVRSGSTYVLRNQNDPVTLSVTAYDKAGNKKISSYSSQRKGINWLAIIIVVLIIIVARVFYKKWKKSHTHAPVTH